MDKVHIKEAILVEGKYDKNTLSQIVDANIFITDGFKIFKNAELRSLLADISQKCGLIVFTDSDSAGFLIRNYIKSFIPAQYLKHAYIPDIYGREKRKRFPGKEGKLGVEGMKPDIILSALYNAGAIVENKEATADRHFITKQDLIMLGISGAPDSASIRAAIKKALNLPEHMNTNTMLKALNTLMTYEEFTDVIQTLEVRNG